tara:strand:- start:82 stop:366 length:285 start_codon:yes stop_codon:yes gene_type:complete
MNEWLKERNVVDMPCVTYNGKCENRQIYYMDSEISKYKNKNPIPGTRYHDADCLFKELVDHCVINNIVDNDNIPLINSDNKIQFMRFVYETSKK